MINDQKEYILCAACRRKTPRDCMRAYSEECQDIYSIELGMTHMDIMHRFNDEIDVTDGGGFFTSFNRYVDRKEAWKIALAAKQIDGKNYLGGYGKLDSLDLYGCGGCGILHWIAEGYKQLNNSY